MALSNWDALAFNNDGVPCSAVFSLKDIVDLSSDKSGREEIFLSSVLSIHKNWVYIENPKMYPQSLSDMRPIIASIHEGRCVIAGFDIVAARGNQDSVFVFVEYDYAINKEVRSKFFAGIGAYGFVGSDRWFGIAGDTYQEFMKFLKENVDPYDPRHIEWFEKVEKQTPLRYNQGDAFIASQFNEKYPATFIGEAEEPVILSVLKDPKM